MKTIIVTSETLRDVQQAAPACVIALGFFDGVHLGHQQVIEAAKLQAQRLQLPLALMSFTTHPLNVLSSTKKVGQLTALEMKRQKLQQLDVDLFYLVEFTRHFAQLTPNEFVEQFLMKLQVKHAVAGFDYSYGKMGAGKLQDIPFFSSGQIQVTEVPCITCDDEKISSTAIRQRLHTGAVHEISRFLGHDYRSKVQLKNGHFRLVDDTMLPTAGRYAVRILTANGQYDTEITIDPFGVMRGMAHIPEEGVAWIKWLACKSIFSKINII